MTQTPTTSSERLSASLLAQQEKTDCRKHGTAFGGLVVCHLDLSTRGIKLRHRPHLRGVRHGLCATSAGASAGESTVALRAPYYSPTPPWSCLLLFFASPFGPKPRPRTLPCVALLATRSGSHWPPQVDPFLTVAKAWPQRVRAEPAIHAQKPSWTTWSKTVFDHSAEQTIP